MNNKGQTILAEYVMIFFIVIAALVAVTALVQRSLQARIHDARNFVIDSANNACDANCQQATGGSISQEYEPYYTQMTAQTQHQEGTTDGVRPGNAQSLGSVYTRQTNETTQMSSTSYQLPANCVNGSCPDASQPAGN